MNKLKSLFLATLVALTTSFLTNCLDDNSKILEDTKTKTKQTSEEKEKEKEGFSMKKFSDFSVSVNNGPVLIPNIPNPSRDRYGVVPYIDFVVNKNNTIDVFWRNKSNEKFISRISLETKKIVQEIPIPSTVNSKGTFLGFESIGNDKFIIGYSKDNSFGNKDSEAWYTAFDITGKELFSTRLWGDKNLDEVWSKGSPAWGGLGTIKYSEKNNVIAIYLAHSMKWNDGVRHQASWIGFLNAKTGKILKKGGQIIGNDWFSSHNFDQRLHLSSDDKFYTLAHGDAFPRALIVNKWSHTKGRESYLEYYKIKGRKGDNLTYTTTGDLAELKNGNLAIVYSTEHDRKKRDLRISIIEGIADKPTISSETWLTDYTDKHAGWGSKVIQYDDEHILVGWNTFSDDNKNISKGSNFILTDLSGKKASEIYSLKNNILYPSQSFKKSSDGKSIIFVSGENNALKVHLVAN